MSLLKHNVQRLEVLFVLGARPSTQHSLEVIPLQVEQHPRSDAHQTTRFTAALGGFAVHGRMIKYAFLANYVAASDYVTHGTLPLYAYLQGTKQDEIQILRWLLLLVKLLALL